MGPAALLGSIGVPVVHELRGVGENFRDHYAPRLVARVKNSTTINELARGIGLAGQIMRWAMGKPSILALSPSLVHWFWKSDDSMDQPDLQGVFSPASYKQGFVGLLDDYPGNDLRCLAASAGKHRLRACAIELIRSTIRSSSRTTCPIRMDRRVLIAGMKLARKLLHTPELAHYFDGDLLPGTRRAERRRIPGLMRGNTVPLRII